MEFIDYLKKGKSINSFNFPNAKIAFLSNFVINGLPEIIKVLCDADNIKVNTYMSPYNQYIQEIINEKSALYSFSPNLIFLILDTKIFLGEFYSFPYRLSGMDRKKFIEDKFQELKELILRLKHNTKSKIIINGFMQPLHSPRGILENKQESSLARLIMHLNNKLEDMAMNDSQLFIFNLTSFFLENGYKNLIDKRMYYLADMRIGPLGLIELAKEYLSYIIPLLSITKKCIVLDLDNTLWGGIIGEDGMKNIKLGPDKQGSVFVDFQKKILGLFERGVILAVNSKNNYEDAMKVIREHKYMILREDNFASLKINWEDKVTNMKEIAEDLNIGLDSLVFIDDDKTNRELVKEVIPEVTVVDLPKEPSNYSDILDGIKLFNTFNITSEDLKKGRLYTEQKERKRFKSKLGGIESFLEKSEIVMEVGSDEESEIPRISQLTKKTNQFNLTTKRYSEEQIKEFMGLDSYKIKFISVRDRFGEYGITGVAVIKMNMKKKLAEIDSFLLSCRILGKKIEFSFLKEIIDEVAILGIKKIHAKFIPTKKNMQCKTFLIEYGFIILNYSDNEVIYELEIGNERINIDHIKIEKWKH